MYKIYNKYKLNKYLNKKLIFNNQIIIKLNFKFKMEGESYKYKMKN